MKSLLLLGILLATVSLLAAEDNHWEVPPDGFVWPTLSQNTFKTYRVSDLPSEIRDYLVGRRGGSSRTPDTTISLSADLDADGSLDWFLDMGDGGSGGSIFEIYTEKNKKLIKIGNVQGGFKLSAPYRGWIQIEGHSRAGGTESVRYLMRFKGSQYECIRSELHNGAKQTVSVLINKTEQDAAANP